MKKYLAFYQKKEYFPLLCDTVCSVEAIPVTHAFIKEVEAEDLEEVYYKMQGEIWSPHGEAMFIIKRTGVGHTSMMVNDIIYDTETGFFWIVQDIGFSLLTK